MLNFPILEKNHSSTSSCGLSRIFIHNSPNSKAVRVAVAAMVGSMLHFIVVLYQLSLLPLLSDTSFVAARGASSPTLFSNTITLGPTITGSAGRALQPLLILDEPPEICYTPCYSGREDDNEHRKHAAVHLVSLARIYSHKNKHVCFTFFVTSFHHNWVHLYTAL